MDGSVAPKADLDRITAMIDEVGACPVGLHQVLAYDYHTLTSRGQVVVDIAVYDPDATVSAYDSRPFQRVEDGTYRPPRDRIRVDAETGSLTQVSISVTARGTWEAYGYLDPDSLEDVDTLLEQGVEAAEYLTSLFWVAVHSPVSLAVTPRPGSDVQPSLDRRQPRSGR